MTLLPFRNGKLLWHGGKIVWNPDCCCDECGCAGTPPAVLYAQILGVVRVNNQECDEICPEEIVLGPFAMDLDANCLWSYAGLYDTCLQSDFNIAAYIVRQDGKAFLVHMFQIGPGGLTDSAEQTNDPADCDSIDGIFSLSSLGVYGCMDFTNATLLIYSQP